MYSRILLPIDLGEDSSWAKALPTAVELARAFKAPLDIVTVVPDFGKAIVASYFPKDFEQQALDDTRAELKRFILEHVPDEVAVAGHVAHGTIYEEINRCADRLGCDLIVMASHRPALRDYLLGPNAARVVRHARQTVMVVRD